ncbi:MAG: hypothetical protein ABIQ86_05415 [Steroidobacteraceae bacterium]
MIRNIPYHHAVRPDYAISPNTASDDAGILADPGAWTYVDFGELHERLLNDWFARIFVTVPVVGYVDSIRYEHVSANLNAASSDNVRMVANRSAGSDL